ncbi:hypothetical protein AQF98_00625 [Pedobacter sp. Hv1]|nr:hypothetical protein AQF98_00625 [Pedobacter sp. Hv1]
MKLSSLLLIGVLFASCGTRKANIDKYLANVVIKENTTLKVDSSSIENEQSMEKEVTKSTDQKDVTQKDVTTQVKEVFKDGVVVERTTTTTITDKVDKSKLEIEKIVEKEKSSLKETLNRIEKTANKVVDSLIKEKHKEVENKKGIGIWVYIALILVAVCSIWCWWKTR